MTMNRNRNCDINDVNGSSLTSGAASGRGAYRDSQIVIMRNRFRGREKELLDYARSHLAQPIQLMDDLLD